MTDQTLYIRQSSALPILNGKVCLITSSNRKRWIIPKGLIDPGYSAGEAALQEAWEEAGLTGSLLQEPIGSYVYEKLGRAYYVTIYLMNVGEVKNDWPERGLRQRIWVTPDVALERIEEPGLFEVLRQTLSDEQAFSAT